MHDEAATHYLDMMDQTQLGHEFLLKEFGMQGEAISTTCILPG